jgi:YesN/AraC family two-component response regulator
VHLLLTDIVMPHMSGIELARSITRISPETRILFMSGYTDDAAVRAVANTPTFIAKPFTAATLVAKVRRALELPWTGLPEQTSGAE